MKHDICSACETVRHCSNNGCVSVSTQDPAAALTAAQIRNEAIREVMAAIAHTDSRKQALEILEGLLRP